MLDFLDSRGAVEAAEAGFDGFAVGEHVGDARGHAQVVLEDLEALVGAYEVGSADGDPDAVRRLEATHFDPVLRTATHDVDRNDAVLDDAGRAVDIGQEEIEGLEALGQAGLELAPLAGREDARQAVDGDDAFVAFFVAVDLERNAFAGEGAGDLVLDIGQVRRGRLG